MSNDTILLSVCIRTLTYVKITYQYYQGVPTSLE